MSITIFASLVPLAGKEDLVEAELRAMLPLSRAEAGCLRYDLYRDLKAAPAFHLIEMYADQAALESHAQSAHFLALRDKLTPLLAQPLSVTLLGEMDVVKK